MGPLSFSYDHQKLVKSSTSFMRTLAPPVDAWYGPVRPTKTRREGLDDFREGSTILGTAHLMAFASVQPSQYFWVAVRLMLICFAVSDKALTLR